MSAVNPSMTFVAYHITYSAHFLFYSVPKSSDQINTTRVTPVCKTMTESGCSAEFIPTRNESLIVQTTVLSDRFIYRSYYTIWLFCFDILLSHRHQTKGPFRGNTWHNAHFIDHGFHNCSSTKSVQRFFFAKQYCWLQCHFEFKFGIPLFQCLTISWFYFAFKTCLLGFKESSWNQCFLTFTTLYGKMSSILMTF